MLTTIFSPAGGGKSFLTILKAIEASKNKRLKILTWEMTTKDILSRVHNCIEYLSLEPPVKITVEQKDLSNVISPILLENKLNELFTEYDVIALDGYFLNQLHSNLSRKEICNILKKCLTDTLRHNPGKEIIVNDNVARESNVNPDSFISNFFALNLDTQNEQTFLVFKENYKGFHVVDYNNKMHSLWGSDLFLFGMNKKKYGKK